MTHPSAVQVHAGEQLVANLVRVNGHSYQVQIGACDTFEGPQDIDEVDDRIMLGEASDFEEACHQAANDLEEMARALRLHAKGLNGRVKEFEAKLKELRAKLDKKPTKKAQAELDRMVERHEGKRVRLETGGDTLEPFAIDGIDDDLEDEE